MKTSPVAVLIKIRQELEPSGDQAALEILTSLVEAAADHPEGALRAEEDEVIERVIITLRECFSFEALVQERRDAGLWGYAATEDLRELTAAAERIARKLESSGALKRAC